MELDLNKIHSTTWMTVVFVVLSTFCPGILYIYCFNADLFLSLDIIKLILLASSISTPFWLLNIFLVGIDGSVKIDSASSYDFKFNIFLGSILTIPIFAIPTLLKIFFDIQVKTGVLMSIILQTLIVLFVIFTGDSSKKRRLKKSKKNT